MGQQVCGQQRVHERLTTVAVHSIDN